MYRHPWVDVDACSGGSDFSQLKESAALKKALAPGASVITLD